ncbi:MAG: SGNH/GDSL hydrolase family protein, partial [Thermodesulfobacteriota bacterium]
MCSPNTNGNKLTGNFGDSTLSYPIPTGFTAGPTVWNYEGVGIGDSIALGTGGGGNTVWTRLETLQGLATGDILNKGVNGEKSGDVDVRFQTDALDVLAKTVYLIAGTNDGVNSVTIPTVIANYLSMYNKLTAMSPTPAFVIGEVTPGTRTGGSNTTIEQFQEWVKKLNAAIRKFCVDNIVKLAPAYQEMAETNVANEDDMLPAYATDTVHPNTTGYDRLGDLFNVAAVPSRMYRWGYSALAVNDESWDWWILNGTSSISGDPDVGTLVLPQNQNADSDVKCLEEFSKTITISPAVAAGTVTIKYRTSTGNFDRNDGVIGWNTYTAPFATSNQFIQIRLEGSSAADANVSTISMTWTAGVPIIALTGSLSGVSALSGSMALNLKLSGSLASVSTATGGIG